MADSPKRLLMFVAVKALYHTRSKAVQTKVPSKIFGHRTEELTRGL